MLVTLDVLKLERSKLVKLRQPPNIAFMLVTLDVLKLEKAKFVSAEKPANICSQEGLAKIVPEPLPATTIVVPVRYTLIFPVSPTSAFHVSSGLVVGV